MRHSSLINLSLLCWAAIAVSLLGSCYEPIEGCLDPLSSNFQLDADNACDDCCEYPTITVDFNSAWDSIDMVAFNRGTVNMDTTSRDTIIMDTISTNTIVMDTIRMDSIVLDTIVVDSIFMRDAIVIDTIRLDTVFEFLTNDVGQNLRITESQFIVSNFYLSGPAIADLYTQDSVILDCEPEETLYNTIEVIDFNVDQAKIENTVLISGYNTLNFDIGISECLAEIDTVGLTNQITSLENLSAAYISEGNYYSLQFILEFEEDLGLERTISFINSEALMSFNLTNELDNFSIVRGSDLFIEIDVNYDEWFKNVLSSDSDDVIKQKIIQNSIDAFTLR